MIHKIENFKGFKILARNKIGPYYALPGDKLSIEYTDKKGNTMELAHAPIETPQKLTTAIVFEFQNEFGLGSGLGAVAGNHEEEF